jgi:hypothetical protein
MRFGAVEVDNKGPSKFLIPKDIVTPEIFVDDSHGFNFLIRPANLLAKQPIQLHCCCAFASPAHK